MAVWDSIAPLIDRGVTAAEDRYAPVAAILALLGLEQDLAMQ